MMQPESNSSANTPYTIVRIKRKRNEEPLDALVVESRVRRKKSRGGLEVFQFAQTVEDEAWRDEKQKKVIQDEVSRLAREASNREESKQSKGQIPDKLKPPVRQKREERKRRYTVLEHDITGEDAGRRTHLKKPLTVTSARGAALPTFKMYDAIPSPEKPRPSLDSEIEKFLPLLNDYLSLNEISLSPSNQPKNEQDTVKPSENAPKIPQIVCDDYVWDIFYRRPAKVDEWAGKDNIATLTGLPSSLDDRYDSASDSEPEDEEDEDSNAEEYYKNDYPDEEDQSDEFHDGSSFDERDEEDDEEEDIF